MRLSDAFNLHEKQDTKSEVWRPLIVGGVLLLCTLIMVCIISVTAFFVGPWFGPLVLILTSLVCTKARGLADSTGILALYWRKLALNDDKYIKAWVLAFLLIGIVYTGVAVVAGTPFTLQLDVESQKLWIGTPTKGFPVSIALWWLWIIVPLLVAIDVTSPFIFAELWGRYLCEIGYPNARNSLTWIKGQAPKNAPVKYTKQKDKDENEDGAGLLPDAAVDFRIG